MANLQHITAGHLDRLTGQLFQGTGLFGDEVKAACATFQADSADEQAQIVRERDATIIRTHEALWQANEAFAVLSKALPDDAQVAALFDVLDLALKAFEAAAGEVLA